MVNRVYIAGPISADIGIPLEKKIQRFHRAADHLDGLGYEPVNPLAVEMDACPGDCNPDAHVGQDGKPTHGWACYMRHDLRALLTCDAILLLPEWESSAGARLEAEVAQTLGMTKMVAELEEDE
jgi:hypothetical protein